MPFQNFKIDNKITPAKSKITQKNHFLLNNPYLQHKTEVKYKQYLPRLSTKVHNKFDCTQLTKISHTKPYISQPSKICRTEISQQSKHLSRMQPQKNKIQLSKSKTNHLKSLWHPTIQCGKKLKSFNATNTITKITDDDSLNQTYHQKNTNYKTHYQQFLISKLQQSGGFQDQRLFRTENFEENIIRNRLKIRSSLQVEGQKCSNSTLLIKKDQHYRTELHEINDGRSQMDPLRPNTRSDFMKKNTDKKTVQKKHAVLSKLKNKNKKTNMYIPPFTHHHKINSSVIENLLKNIQLQSQIKNYEAQTFAKQNLFIIPQDNRKLQRQIQQIQSYFIKNKKPWFSQHLQNILLNQKNNLKPTQVFQKPNQRSRSEKIGKIVRQMTNAASEDLNHSQNFYQQDPFDQPLKQSKQSEQNQQHTVVLHDNSYRKQIIQLDSSTERNHTQTNFQSSQKLIKLPSDELPIHAQEKSLKNLNQPDINDSNFKIPFNNRPKQTQSAKQKKSVHRNKKKAQSQSQCIIF